MSNARQASHLLRQSLRANAAFSGFSGMGMLVASGAIASYLGLQRPAVLIPIGVSLLLFCASLLFNSFRDAMSLAEVRLAIGMDIAWVLGSVFVVGADILSRQGNWMVAIAADVVLAFAVLQFLGLRRITRAAAVQS